jgi:uncharacterized protein YybS (DUF2232 family)
MIAIANFVMKGPMQAYLASLGFALLAVWFSPLGFFTGAIIALVTLRVGQAEGVKTLLLSLIGHLALSSWLSGSYLPGLVVIAEFMLPVWILAVVLRQTNSLGMTLQVAALMAGSALVLAHLMIGDMQAWWLGLFNQTLQPMLEQAGVSYSLETIEQTTAMITMLLAMFAVVLWYSVVLAARWMQGVLYYPGQFQADFHQLRLPRSLAYVMIAVAISSIFLNDATGGLLGDLFGLLSVVLMFQGLAVAHHSVKLKNLSNGWLIALYFLLFVFPQTVLVLAIVGLADQFSDFRNRWVQGK